MRAPILLVSRPGADSHRVASLRHRSYVSDMESRYPRPDRSGYTPNFEKTPENEILDIAWQEGVLKDGRPFRGELWVQEHITSVTFFCSTAGIENYTREDFIRMVEEEGLQNFKSSADDRRFLYAQKMTDYSGHELWSINIVVGDESDQYTDGGQVFYPYSKRTNRLKFEPG
jgi:hypothetical protein